MVDSFTPGGPTDEPLIDPLTVPRTRRPLTGEAIREDRSITLPDEESSGGWRSAMSWVLTVGIAIVVTLLLRIFAFQPYSIPSPSMVPTLEVGDRVLVSKFSKDPARGDVIVFNRPPNDLARSADDPPVLIKRVIGLPGESVAAKDGHVYIDGKLLEEGYLATGTVTTFPNDQPINVPADDLLVLGDNRGNSADGRVFGPIPKSLIVGRALFKFWPFNRAGSL